MSTSSTVEKKSSCTQTIATNIVSTSRNQSTVCTLPQIAPKGQRYNYYNEVQNAKRRKNYYKMLTPNISTKKDIISPLLVNGHQKVKINFSNEELFIKVNGNKQHNNIIEKSRHLIPKEDIKEDSAFNHIKNILCAKIINQHSNKDQTKKRLSNSCDNIEDNFYTLRSRYRNYRNYMMKSQENIIIKKPKILKNYQKVLIEENKPKSQAKCYNLQFSKPVKFFLNPYQDILKSKGINVLYGKKIKKGRNVSNEEDKAMSYIIHSDRTPMIKLL